MMEFAKRYWMQIRAQLEGMSLSGKWLIASLLVILLMAASLMMLYAGSEETVSLGLAGGNASEAVARLNNVGIQAEVVAGEIRVPPKNRYQAFQILFQGDLLGESPANAFDRMFAGQSAWETDKRGEQRYNNARSRFLSGVITNITGVKSADVLIDPGQDGIGKRHVRASAMVNITPQGGRKVDTEMADAVAALVSGAVARLDATDVKIVDARTGRRVAVSDPSNMLPSDAIEVKRDIEERKRREIENILDYIPGVRVGVNVLMDSIAARQERRTEYDKSQPIQSELIDESSSRNIANAGEPGPRSNTGLSINGSGRGGKEETKSLSETTFYEHKPVILQQETTLTGHQVKQINVAINVPRSFFVGLFKQKNPDTEDEPTDAALAPMVADHLAKIEQKVQVLTLADVQGEVRADMVPDAPLLVMAGTGGAIGKVLDGGWAGPAGIGLLALASLGLMLGMVRKATRPESLPSIEELAGVPPSLPSDEELIGEAEESETSMQGVELNEDELRSRRIAEQISDLVKADPSEAGRLLGKWVLMND